MNWKGRERKWSWHILRFSPRICLETMNQSVDLELIPRTSEYKRGVLTIRTRRLLIVLLKPLKNEMEILFLRLSD